MGIDNQNKSDKIKNGYELFLCIFIFSSVILVKHLSLFKQHFSPSKNPVEGLLKPKFFNVNFPSK